MGYFRFSFVRKILVHWETKPTQHTQKRPACSIHFFRQDFTKKNTCVFFRTHAFAVWKKMSRNKIMNLVFVFPHDSIFIPFYYYITILLYYYITILLYCYIAILLYCYIAITFFSVAPPQQSTRQVVSKKSLSKTGGLKSTVTETEVSEWR